MIFPEYKLGQYQAQNNSKARYRMCTAALSPLSINNIFSRASEEELAEWDTLSLSYANEYGDLALRTIIAEQYPGLSSDNIVTFSGTQEALFCIMQATIQSGDHSITIDPAYEPLFKLPESFGATVSKIPLEILPVSNATKGLSRWSLPLDTLLSTAQDGFNQLIINFPHNPTGCMIDSATQKILIDCCHNQDAWLISDEVFRGLEHNPLKQLPPAASLYKKGISLGSIGKPFGLGGVRIGWIACQNLPILEKVIQVKRSLSICSSRADEWISKVALNNSQYFLNITRDLLNNHIQILNNEASSLNNINWISSEAAGIAFPSISKPLNIAHFSRNLMAEKSIMIIPGRCFSNNDIFKNHFRLGFGLSNFPQVWKAFFHFSQQQ